MMIELAYAPPAEREEIAAFMNTAFARAKWDLDGWRRLLAGRWSGPDGHFALTVRNEGRLVGVLGMNSVMRPCASGMAEYINLTSWYMDKSLRGQGVGGRLMSMAIADTKACVTNLSSARGALPLVDRVGFQVLDKHRLVWRAQREGNKFPVLDGAEMAPFLDKVSAQIFADHAGLDLRFVVVQTPDGPCPLVVSVKQKVDEYVTYETMYLGARDIFAAHARSIANSVLPSRDAVLSVDQRFAPKSTRIEAREDIPVPRFYTPGRMLPHEVDHMYSEIVLMGMKMY